MQEQEKKGTMRSFATLIILPAFLLIAGFSSSGNGLESLWGKVEEDGSVKTPWGNVGKDGKVTSIWDKAPEEKEKEKPQKEKPEKEKDEKHSSCPCWKYFWEKMLEKYTKGEKFSARDNATILFFFSDEKMVKNEAFLNQD